MQLLLYFTWCRHGRYRCSKVDLHGTSSRVGYFPFQDLLGPRCSGALKLTLFWRFYPSVVSRHHRLFPRWVLHQKINKTVNKHTWNTHVYLLNSPSICFGNFMSSGLLVNTSKENSMVSYSVKTILSVYIWQLHKNMFISVFSWHSLALLTLFALRHHQHTFNTVINLSDY